MRSAIRSLVGAWKSEDPDSRSIFVIRHQHDVLAARVVDAVDGEEFNVSKLRARRGALSFETLVPSTGVRAKHVLRPVSERALVEEFSFSEQWIKVSRAKLERLRKRINSLRKKTEEPGGMPTARLTGGSAQSPQQSVIKALIGAWETQDMDSPAVLVFACENGVFSGSGFNSMDGDQIAISKLRQLKDGITFETGAAAPGFRPKHALRPLSPRALAHEFTFLQRWTKMPRAEAQRLLMRLGKMRARGRKPDPAY